MKKKLIIFLGLKGSFKWAIRQLKKGQLVSFSDRAGEVKFRLSNDGKNIVEWDFSEKLEDVDWNNWESADFMITYIDDINWCIYEWKQ